MKKMLLITAFLFGCSFMLRAQEQVWEGSREKLLDIREQGRKKVSRIKQWKEHIAQWGLDSNFNHALSLSARLHTDGWSGGVYYLRQKAPGRKVLWQLHFAGLKHEKEIKQQRNNQAFTYLGKNTPYIFGKINNAYTLQLGYGREQMLLPALLDGNMSVGLRYAAGPALALLKPYYLHLIYVEYTPELVAHLETERYTEANSSHFLDAGLIQGKEKWSKGLGEMKYIPGLFAELAFTIEPERPKSFVKTISIGGNAAFYSSKIEMMAGRKAYPYQASFFVGLALGKRWK